MVGAMEPSEDQIVAMNTHLKRACVQGCPVCHAAQLQFNRIVAVANIPTPNSSDAPTYTPLALLMCRNCLHTMQFAWLPIEATIPTGNNATGLVARLVGAVRDLVG